MKRILSFLLIFSVISTASLKAQDAFTTNNNFNFVYSNPAYAGSKNMMRFSLNNQMTWITAIHKTYFNSATADFSVKRLGIGISGGYDMPTTGLKNTKNDWAFSYKFGSNRKFVIRPGVQASFVNSSINFDDLVFYDQLSVYDGTNTNIPTAAELVNTNFTLIDVSAGLVTQFPVEIRRTHPGWINFGFAVHHLTNNEYAAMGTKNVFYPKKYSAHGGFFIPLYKRDPETKLRVASGWMLYPNFKYHLQQDFSLINVGLIVYKSPFFVGLASQTFQRPSIFHKNQVVGTLGFETTLSRYFSLQLMYNADLGVSFNTRTKNSSPFLTHEFSLVIIFANKRKNDCSKSLEYNKKRWFNNNELHTRHQGECPPGKTLRRTSNQSKPMFYPMELPEAYIGF